MNCSTPGLLVHHQLLEFTQTHVHCGSAGKESACNVGYLDSIPGLGRSPGEGKGYSLQYSGLENPKDRGAWQATVHGVAELDTTEAIGHIQLSPVTQSCLTICDPMDCSTPGFPVHHQLLELAQIGVY